MQELKTDKDIEREKLQEEGSPDYWDAYDSAEVFKTAERVKLEISRPEANCPKCGSSRLRRRMIDLPMLEDKISFKRARVLYCPDCRISQIPEESLKELTDRLKAVGAKVDSDTFAAAVNEGLASYSKKWAKKVNQRKVMSIYFPRREGSPAKAQISLLVSDRLYPILRSLTSEDVRRLLGLQYFEDLEKEAKERDRSISQYLKHEIGKRTLSDNSDSEAQATEETLSEDTREETNRAQSSTHKIVTLRPGKVDAHYFEDENEERYKLAADSQEADESFFVVDAGEDFVGELSYSFMTSSLFLKVIKDNFNLDVFDVKLLFTDDNVEEKKDVRIEDEQILLLRDTAYTEKNVKEIILTSK